jgi:hypothetical protein
MRILTHVRFSLTLFSLSAAGCGSETGTAAEGVALSTRRRPTRALPSPEATANVFRAVARTTSETPRRRATPTPDFDRDAPVGCEHDNRIESIEAASQHPGWVLVHGRVDQMPATAIELVDPAQPEGSRIEGRQFRAAIVSTSTHDLGRLGSYQTILLPTARVVVARRHDLRRNVSSPQWEDDRQSEAMSLREGQEFVAVVRPRGGEQPAHVLTFAIVEGGQIRRTFLSQPLGTEVRALVNTWNTHRTSARSGGMS